MSDHHLQKIESKLKELINLVNIAQKEISQKVSVCDMEISDLLHYLKDSRLNAREICNFYKNLKEVTLRRDNVKNKEGSKIMQIRSMAEGIVNIISQPYVQKPYIPRIRTDLKTTKKTEQHKPLSNIQKLQQVNKSNIKFHYSKQDEKMENLFQQIKNK